MRVVAVELVFSYPKELSQIHDHGKRIGIFRLPTGAFVLERRLQGRDETLRTVPLDYCQEFSLSQVFAASSVQAKSQQFATAVQFCVGNLKNPGDLAERRSWKNSRNPALTRRSWWRLDRCATHKWKGLEHVPALKNLRLRHTCSP